MGIVVFDPAAFVAMYPEFSTVNSTVLQIYFGRATMQLDNTDCSRVQDVSQRAALLYLLVAHIAAMNGSGVNGQGASPLVGRLSSATEGSVSVSTEYAAPANATEAWFLQTKYGAEYWAATAAYRTAIYIAPPPLCTGHPVSPFDWRC